MKRGRAQASLGYGFEALELERIISFTVPENAASRCVMDKCGFVQRGETRWRGLDQVWYATDRREWEAAEDRLLNADQLDQACSSGWPSPEASAIVGRVPSMRKATTSRKSPLSL